jgi:signal peptidase I
MEPNATTSLTETLSNLNITWILVIVTGLTVLRLALIRLTSPGARSLAEILESGMLAIALVYLIIQPFFLRAYFIPSASMVPTLLGKDNQGDHILVCKSSYRLHPPHRDDVVVFVPPALAIAGENLGEPGSVYFIKRLVAVPGDSLQVVRGKFIVNGFVWGHEDVRNALLTNGVFGSNAVSESADDQAADFHVKFVDNGVLADGKFVTKEAVAKMLTEMPEATVDVQPGYSILNGKRLSEPFIAEDPDYDLKIYQGQPLKYDPMRVKYSLNDMPISKAEYDHDNMSASGPIPAGRYFMMGDNRNDSNDSTNWGTVPADQLVGKAELIFWPFDRFHVIH